MKAVRIAVTTVFVLTALAALGYFAVRALDTFRPRGDISLRPRLKPGTLLAVTDTLTLGNGAAAKRWSAVYNDEVLQAEGGRASKIRRTWVEVEDGVQGPPHPAPVSDVLLVDAGGPRIEKSGEPWKGFPVAWPDPFESALPDAPVHMSSRWNSSPSQAAAIASFLARQTAVSARMESKLEQEMERDGLPVLRIRVALEAMLDGERTLEAWFDLFYSRADGDLLDVEALGRIEGPEDSQSMSFTRRKRVRKAP